MYEFGYDPRAAIKSSRHRDGKRIGWAADQFEGVGGDCFNFFFFFLYFSFTTVIECVQNYRSRGSAWAVVAADRTRLWGCDGENIQ